MTDKHICDGLRERSGRTRWWAAEVPQDFANGTIRYCQCGKTWIAGKQEGMWAQTLWRRELVVERLWRAVVGRVRLSRRMAR